MIVSPKSQQLYQMLLSSKSPLSAIQLATKLQVFPNTIYRFAEPLINMGLVVKTKDYPNKFEAKSIDEGLSLFLLNQNDWFFRQFSSPNHIKEINNSNNISESKQIKISFIKSRDELMNISVGEIDNSNKSVDLLRSGRETPADVMLAMVKAKQRNVVVRMLIQDYSQENVETVSNWKKNGILVRKTSLRHVRLMLYDSTVVYFMSYTNTDSEKDLGMKITYPPFATILSKLFNEWWRTAEKI